MVFVVTLSDREILAATPHLRNTQRLTKSFLKSNIGVRHGSRLTIVLKEGDDGRRDLAWLGVVSHQGVSGEFDGTITIDPLREVYGDIAIDGPTGIWADLPAQSQRAFESAGSM